VEEHYLLSAYLKKISKEADGSIVLFLNIYLPVLIFLVSSKISLNLFSNLVMNFSYIVYVSFIYNYIYSEVIIFV